MPASLPGSTRVQNEANPTLGQFVTFDPLSGPKGSPLDQQMFDYSTGSPLGWNATTRLPIKIAGTATPSTGALSTGIGFGPEQVIGSLPSSAQAINDAGFDDNMIPGEVPVYASGPPTVWGTPTFSSTRMYIGGGRMVASTTYPGVPFAVSPYATAGIALVGGGGGASRDGGAGPTTYTGFPLKMVTAAGAVAADAVIETGYVNKSGVAMTTGQSAFGVASTQLAAAS